MNWNCIYLNDSHGTQLNGYHTKKSIRHPIMQRWCSNRKSLSFIICMYLLNTEHWTPNTVKEKIIRTYRKNRFNNNQQFQNVPHVRASRFSFFPSVLNLIRKFAGLVTCALPYMWIDIMPAMSVVSSEQVKNMQLNIVVPIADILDATNTFNVRC